MLKRERKMNIFDIRQDPEVKVEYIEDSPIFTIDNFYKYPDKVYEYIFEEPLNEGIVGLWKINQKPSFNGIYFDDRRLSEFDERLFHIYFFLSNLIEDNNYTFRPEISTNATLFKDDKDSLKFNNYIDNYWWPHIDYGYNGIVYFHDEWGTNLYSSELLDDYNEKENKGINEHYEPWRPKNKYKLLKTLEPAYNRLVFFDGAKFPHGMNVTNDRYFGYEYRNNQVFFMDPPDEKIEYFCI